MSSLPKKSESRKVLKGRATVISYERNPEEFFLRVSIPGTSSFRSKRIPDASTLDAACDAAIDVWEEFKEEPVSEEHVAERRRKSSKKITVEKMALEYVVQEEKRYDKGEIGRDWWVRVKRIMKYMVDIYIPRTCTTATE